MSVIIPAYNAERTIVRALTHTKAQRGLPSPAEIIVVDDGSRDRTVEVAASQGVRVIRQANSGPAAARNKGFRNSHGKYVLFTDSDCIPDADWAARLIEAFDEPEVGAAGGGYRIANSGLIADGMHWEIVARHRRFGRYVRALGSYNLTVRREVMEAVGGFDETYPTASAEDNDLSYRILAAGYKLRWVQEAKVAHHHTTQLSKYLKEQYRHGFFRAKLYGRHAGKMSGDDYTTVKDILEPLLVGALVVSLVICWVGKLAFVPLGILAVLAGIQIPMTIRMVRCSRKLSVTFHAIVMFLRAFARTTGFVICIASQMWRSATAVGKRKGAG